MILLEPKSNYEDCIIGEDYYGTRAVYDAEKVIKALMIFDSMTYDEALEYFDYNIAGAYVGEETPIYIWRKDGSDE